MPTQTAVFDLGKVLLDFDYSRAAKGLARFCRTPMAEVQKLLDQSSLLFRYETGLITTEIFFDEIRAQTGFCGQLNDFAELFGDIFTPVEEMIRLQAELRGAGIPTYIFSNTNPLAVEHIRRRYPFFHNFDGYILSWEEGGMKPDPRLYEAVERMTGKRGADLVYLDDRPENVAAAQARGWTAHLHESPEKSAKEFRKIFNGQLRHEKISDPNQNRNQSHLEKSSG